MASERIQASSTRCPRAGFEAMFLSSCISQQKGYGTKVTHLCCESLGFSGVERALGKCQCYCQEFNIRCGFAGVFESISIAASLRSEPDGFNLGFRRLAWTLLPEGQQQTAEQTQGPGNRSDPSLHERMARQYSVRRQKLPPEASDVFSLRCPTRFALLTYGPE